MFPQVEVSSPNAEIENSPLCQAQTDATADPELPTPVNTEPRTSDTGTALILSVVASPPDNHKHPSVLSIPLNHRANLFRVFPQN